MMVKSLLVRLLRHLAWNYNVAVGPWRRLGRPEGLQWAEYLRRFGGLHAMGSECYILPDVLITDPAYVRLGNNVMLTGCSLIGHDGSIAMLNRAYGKKLDRVGKIDIRDNVFVGRGATILPGVTIGPNAIVGIGAVVTRDVPPNSVVAGVPARRVGSLDESVERLQRQTDELPWAHLIAERAGAFDPGVEQELVRRRVEHFFGTASPSPQD